MITIRFSTNVNNPESHHAIVAWMKSYDFTYNPLNHEWNSYKHYEDIRWYPLFEQGLNLEADITISFNKVETIGR